MYLFWHVSTLSLSSATQRFRTLRTSPSSPDAWDVAGCLGCAAGRLGALVFERHDRASPSSAIERGERNPALENLCAISNALGISLTELFRF